jgi:anti-anti-sigma regulatory factor
MTNKFYVQSDHADVVVLRICEPELSDLVLEDRFSVALSGFVESRRPQKLLLDLSEVDYCATGVINSFLALRQQVVQYGGEFKLCSLCEALRMALRSLKLDKTVFSIHLSVEDGVKAFIASA